jgi:hypothetical protein
MTAHLVSKKGRLKFLYPPARGRDGISEVYAMRRRFFRAESLPPAGAQLRDQEAASRAAVSLAAAPGPMHEPQLEPRDEAVFLLTAAAEIEHALVVQYLFAAYSLRVVSGEPNFEELLKIQSLILQIAREEMGHLITVQNLLHLVGGPLNFNREHSPYASEIYPFRFKLEPLTLDTLAKYVVAESPSPLPDKFPEADRIIYEQITVRAQRSNDGETVNHVGRVFQRLEQLFAGEKGGVKNEDFRLDTTAIQAKFKDWGFVPENAPLGERLIIETIEGVDVAEVRKAATRAIKDIGLQGEGFDIPEAGTGQSESHFERFFDIYKRLEPLAQAGGQLTWPVTENPNTTPEPSEAPSLMKMLEMVVEAHESKGRITHPRSRAWAHLFNLRYRLLLAYLSHFLRLSQDLYVTQSGPAQGDRTERGLLLIWTFNEMRRLKKIAAKLVQLPRDEQPSGVNAGPPFELPYTLNLPEREEDRWRAHLDVSRAAVRLIRGPLQQGDPLDAEDGFLADLAAQDERDQAILHSLAEKRGVPAGSLPTDFKKVVSILEESVRGFDIIGSVHGSFWDRKTRDQFIIFPPPDFSDDHIIKHNPGGGFDADGSPLVIRIEHTNPEQRMPFFRPPIPEERTKFIREWIGRDCPDNKPPGQPGIERERNPTQEAVGPPVPPGPALSFEVDIKGLFRASPDRTVMLAISGFDLHKFEDVRDNADRILARIEDGTMPCDGNWSLDKIEKLRKWIADGKNP